jgi:thiopeptide-type bacteriocin biosynthesis protein
VSIGNADQQLVFDLANEQEILFFLQNLKGLKDVTIQEYLLPGKHVKAGNKPLAAQYIAFLSHGQKIYRETSRLPAPPKAAEERDFILGENWLHLKIYCTPESANQLIAKMIGPFIYKNYRLINGWFFIRYADDGHHLRLRLKIDPENLGLLLIAFKAHLKTGGNNQLVKEYRGDIYRRELERYGSAIIGLVEEVFNAGSELVSKYIILKENDGTVLTDFQLGLLSAYQMIACFLEDLQMITAFTESITNNFLKEFSADKRLKMDIDLKYRSLREEISLLLERGQNDKDDKGALKLLFRTLDSKMKKVWEAVRPLAEAEREKVLADLVHMQMNRTFQFSQRRQEFMVYYCIYKYTASLKARQGKAGVQG